MTSILGTLEIAVEPIIAEAKVWEQKAVDFLKDIPITLTQKAVALLKQTSIGTAVANLISLASLSSAPGQDKFAAVLSAIEGAYNAFVSNGGLAGLIATGVSVLRQLVQSLFDDFAAAFLKPTLQLPVAA